MTEENLTMFHGTNMKRVLLKAGSWVTLAREEAIDYARSTDVNNVLEKRQTTGEKWLLQLNVPADQIEWIDGCGDPEFDGSHGKIKTDLPVLDAHKIPDCSG